MGGKCQWYVLEGNFCGSNGFLKIACFSRAVKIFTFKCLITKIFQKPIKMYEWWKQLACFLSLIYVSESQNLITSLQWRPFFWWKEEPALGAESVCWDHDLKSEGATVCLEARGPGVDNVRPREISAQIEIALQVGSQEAHQSSGSCPLCGKEELLLNSHYLFCLMEPCHPHRTHHAQLSPSCKLQLSSLGRLRFSETYKTKYQLKSNCSFNFFF